MNKPVQIWPIAKKYQGEVMSCIPKILEMKGTKEILPIPKTCDEGVRTGVVVEDGGNYRGYDYLVTFSDLGFRCGYVAIPPEHPVYSFHNEDYNYPDLEVHGGVTFFDKGHIAEMLLNHSCEDKWVGFDCGHAWDLTDIECADRYFPDLRPTRRAYVVSNASARFSNDAELRTKQFTIDQCKHLIDQLIEKAA